MRIAEFLIRSALCGMLLASWTQGARSQTIGACLANINVKDKVVVLDLIPGGSVAQVANCKKAEMWREKFYITNQAVIDAAASGTSAFYVSELEKNLAAQELAIADLETKIAQNDTLSSLVVSAKVLLGEASKSEALITCSKRLKSVSCAMGLISLMGFTWDVVTGDITKTKIGEEVEKQKVQLSKYKTELAALKAKLASIDMAQIKADVEQTFLGMCTAIKRDCL